jgi:hypothetical protein
VSPHAVGSNAAGHRARRRTVIEARPCDLLINTLSSARVAPMTASGASASFAQARANGSKNAPEAVVIQPMYSRGGFVAALLRQLISPLPRTAVKIPILLRRAGSNVTSVPTNASINTRSSGAMKVHHHPGSEDHRRFPEAVLKFRQRWPRWPMKSRVTRIHPLRSRGMAAGRCGSKERPPYSSCASRQGLILADCGVAANRMGCVAQPSRRSFGHPTESPAGDGGAFLSSTAPALVTPKVC